ncbi:MAG: amidohydrolase family protein [Nitrososphaerales archaeon]
MIKNYVTDLPKPNRVLIKDAKFLITEEGQVRNQSLLVDDRKILAIGDHSLLNSKFGPAEVVIDASKSIVMPGFVNNHSHIAMSLLRGYAEDLPLLNWLNDKVWPAEAKLTPEDIYLGAVAGCAEALLSGTTSITSVYFYDERGSEPEALYDTGVRGILAHGVFDWTREVAVKKTKEMVSAYHGKDQGRIRIATSPHAPYTCSPELLKEIEDLRSDLNQKSGNEYRVMNTLHVAEARTEAKEIESKYEVSVKDGIASYLDSLGVLTDETIAAHCIHLTQNDIESFNRSGASIASCPISNLKVGMGMADLPKIISNEITLSLGTDGPASNNTLDMFETVKMTSLLSKGLMGDTTLMGSRTCFELATLGGARSMHQQSETGSLVVGKRADIVVLDISDPHSSPLYDPYSHIVYSANSHDVKDVLIDGRILVKDRKIATVDLEKLKQMITRRVIDLGFMK